MLLGLSKKQLKAVESEASVTLLHGCAGSHKTSILIQHGLQKVAKHGSKVLFLTLVSSVTDEIRQRIEAQMQVQLQRTGNHFEGDNIEIANFDAWIHEQLTKMGVDVNKLGIGGLFETKRQVLASEISESKCDSFYMKSGFAANVLIVDEVQDIDPAKMALILAIYRNGVIDMNNNKTSLFFAGDFMQTIFDKALAKNQHPILMLRKLDKAEFLEINIRTCYRCPKAHVRFVNLITRPFLERLGLKPMLANNNNLVDKPFLFTHSTLSFSLNTNPERLARTVCRMIQTLFLYDPTLRPEDVAILMNKTNKNAVFYQLCHKLLRKKANSAHHFWTEGDGYSVSIDWLKAEGRTVLLSVHGAKGKGHKAVFFLGFDEFSYPNANQAELVSESLLNVALTRSTKYLFIGVNEVASRYLHAATLSPEFKDQVYATWIPDSLAAITVPPVYRAMSACLSEPCEPSFKKALTLRDLTTKTMKKTIQVKEHIVKSFEEMPLNWAEMLNRMRPVQFGQKIHVKADLEQWHIPMGEMAERLLQHRLRPQDLLDSWNWMKNRPIFYTVKEELLCLVQDARWNWSGCTSDWFKLRNRFNELPEQPHMIFHVGFQLIVESLETVLARPWSDLGGSEFWNASIFISECEQSLRNPARMRTLSLPTLFKRRRIFKRLKENVDAFIAAEHLFDCVSQLQFQKPYRLEVADNEPAVYSICGAADMVRNDNQNHTIYEIKASQKEFVLAWEVQVLLYAALSKYTEQNTQNRPRLVIVNLLSGILHKSRPHSAQLKELITKTISHHFTALSAPN